MNRRAIIGAAAAALALAAVPKRSRADTRKLRPPGALKPGAFEASCIGCFRCAEVCPTRVIRFPSALAVENATPHLEFDDRACVLCMKCTDVCPTDALVPVQVDAVRIGVPKLKRSECLPWTGRGICRLCYQVCPYPDRAVELVGPQKAPLFHAEACVGCGLCEEACPDSARAIVILPSSDAAAGIEPA